MDKGARESITNFEKGVGDVAITYENEVLVARIEGKEYDYVIPRSTILIENPVALVDKNVDKHGVREVAEAFVAFLPRRRRSARSRSTACARWTSRWPPRRPPSTRRSRTSGRSTPWAAGRGGDTRSTAATAASRALSRRSTRPDDRATRSFRERRGAAVAAPGNRRRAGPWGRWGLRATAALYLGLMILLPLAAVAQHGCAGDWPRSGATSPSRWRSRRSR